MCDVEKINPFIKWVGGKRKLLRNLVENLPKYINNYYEPFLGGGALFFGVKNRFNNAFLSDINFDLVASYNVVKNNPEKLCDYIEKHLQNHNTEYFYRVQTTNNSNNPIDISARFVYLNCYSFRGMYRINKKGDLKISCANRKANLETINYNIMRASSSLQNINIFAGDFSFINPQADDFVYFDPPYHKSGETFYTRLPFDEGEQIRLRDFADKLDNKKVKFMLSNSKTDFIVNLYKNYNIRTLQLSYAINNHSKTNEEVLITNY